METTSKLYKLMHTSRDTREAYDWVFSLTPVSVAFVFYVLFIMSANFEQTGALLVYGAAAGFTGLETYWIVRGWRNNNLSTIILSTIAIALTLGLLKLFMYFL